MAKNIYRFTNNIIKTASRYLRYNR